ncbi:SusC/RagA family TonB-linked outer membrane protein [Chitinophaga rhizophila]|uniref:SusC/RagA family TonB-linked outer membrane protein n=1 Tax=Chitinophaga rhizophila TaxID=2866212 RepID=A0ABS7GH91_9BACT|nr:SusC/RagA family TonB-linked outer membrane protein [Chitinophaga rhizophila]MBW8686796.1 SusC/RagA family TonB-linked outer membrane protein [Chitinophaga rhizophila]
MRLQKKYASISFLFLLFPLLFIAIKTQSQHQNSVLDTKYVTVNKHHVPFADILSALEQQTGLLLNTARDGRELASLHVQQETLRAALDKLFGKDQMEYILLEKSRVVKIVPRGQGHNNGNNTKGNENEQVVSPDRSVYHISGHVKDETGIYLPGATIHVKGKKDGARTDSTGAFTLVTSESRPRLQVSYVGYETLEKFVEPGSGITLVLKQGNRGLDEVTIVGYMDNSRRYTAGSVSRITAAEIEGHPIGNPLLSLQGRVPGMVITQSSGIAGSSIRVNLRGTNSLFNGSDPLYIVNGAQLPINSEQINLLSSVASQNENGGISPFSLFGLTDIESIDIQKDAVATAAYGSRGANGVVHITTKRPDSGRLKVTVNYMQGVSNVSHHLHLLNTQQYLGMRREAFKNDGLILNDRPGNPGYAYDLLLWDTMRYTNWQKMLTGRSAALRDFNIGVSGGSKTTRVLLSTGIYREGAVYSKDMSYLRSNINLALNHESRDSSFNLGIYANYSIDNNQLFNPTTNGEFLPPNAPKPYDERNKLVWEEKGEMFANPLAELLKRYSIVKNNLIVNVAPSYELFRHFKVKANIAFSGINVYENSTVPIAAQNPYADSTITGSSSFATGRYKSIMIDNMAEYAIHSRFGDIMLLAGYSYQFARSNTSIITGLGYTNDADLRFKERAPVKTAELRDPNEYRYGALFSQLNYRYHQKYILDMTFRRDGSSKFSPERRFGSFWAAGAAWIFSKEAFFAHFDSWLRYGKLRGSMGVTGNDKIANYKYLDTWSPIPSGPYQGIPGLAPDALYNPAYSWETCRKTELGLEMEFVPAAMFLSAAYFSNVSSDQLVKYNLLVQTGFNSILKNIDADILNRGWEFTFDATLLKTNRMKLSAGLNFTIPENRLLTFQDLKKSSYNDTYVLGQSVRVLNRLRSDGIDPKTGTFIIRDKDGNGIYNGADYEVIGHLDPDWYGSLRLGLEWKRLSIMVLSDFRKQIAPNYLHAIYLNNILPGAPRNQSVEVLDHWQVPGDASLYPKYSTQSGGAVYGDRRLIVNSERAYSDASFLKLRNVFIYYTIQPFRLSHLRMQSIRLYCKAQNLFTLTRYRAGDPETASPLSLASLRTVTMGLQVTF